MGKYGAPKRGRHITGELPDDLMHIIFLKLDFKSKVSAGQACKKWDQLLKAPIAGARHWDVDYNLDTIMSSQALTSTEQVPIVEEFNATIGRWLFNRAAAINVVHVTVTLSSDQQGVAARTVLENQLPLLAGCLAKHVNRLEFTFNRGSPFESPLLSSSGFLSVLCPMVKRLTLLSMVVPISARQFAAICELSSLEELSIEAEQDGLQEITPDISKLVNLTNLNFDENRSLEDIPESISCLQKLELIRIYGSSITEVPPGLTTLANLADMAIMNCGPLRLPHSLQGLRSLTSLNLANCSLEKIPDALSELATLTLLDVGENYFHSHDGWWPTTLSRLTKLAELVMLSSHIVSLPPHISGLQQLTRMDVSDNKLRSLPQQLSSLQNLRDLVADWNSFPTVPVSVLSSLTALTSISLYDQKCEGSPTFTVSSSLLPILHPGLVELDLTQDIQWDPLSLYHLERAMAEVAGRAPVLKLMFLREGRR